MLRALMRGLHYAHGASQRSGGADSEGMESGSRKTAQIAYDVAMPTYNMRGDASDELVATSIKRALQDAKINQSNFTPKDFVDWTSRARCSAS